MAEKICTKPGCSPRCLKRPPITEPGCPHVRRLGWYETQMYSAGEGTLEAYLSTDSSEVYSLMLLAYYPHFGKRFLVFDNRNLPSQRHQVIDSYFNRGPSFTETNGQNVIDNISSYIFGIILKLPLVSQATYALVDSCRMRDRIALRSSYVLSWSSSTQMTSRNAKLADG